jgi:hypothetical protein
MPEELTSPAPARSDVPAEVARGNGLGLGQLARRCPPSRGLRQVSPETLARWITRGVNGPGGCRVHLDAVRLGGRWVSTEAALARFIAALTPSQTDTSDQAAAQTKPQAARTRQDAQERARQELDRLGI